MSVKKIRFLLDSVKHFRPVLVRDGQHLLRSRSLDLSRCICWLERKGGEKIEPCRAGMQKRNQFVWTNHANRATGFLHLKTWTLPVGAVQNRWGNISPRQRRRKTRWPTDLICMVMVSSRKRKEEWDGGEGGRRFHQRPHHAIRRRPR